MDLLYKIAITKIPLVGAVHAKTLISYCGGVKEVFQTRKKTLLSIPGIGEKITHSILNFKGLKQAEDELKFIEKNGIQTYFFLDKNYPHRLKHYSDSPVMLYYKGRADLNQERIVAVVGTRKPTPYGLAVCEELVEGLGQYNAIVLSGLAYGVDICAHRKSIQNGLATIGVLAHGLQKIYPSSHQDTARKMLENGGLLSEYTSDQGPDREHFPMRNRIIAGLCDAMVVIESPASGGSIISAHLANGYNKDVFAVPGRLKDATSKGCNYLLKTHQAAMIESAKDIGYIMGWEEKENQTIQRQLFIELDDDEQIIVNALSEADDFAIDELSNITQLKQGKLSAHLLELEFKGVVRSLPGKRYMIL